MPAAVLDRAAIRREIDWLLDGRDPVRAARLCEALALLEQADDLERKAAALLATAAAAERDDRGGADRGST